MKENTAIGFKISRDTFFSQRHFSLFADAICYKKEKASPLFPTLQYIMLFFCSDKSPLVGDWSGVGGGVDCFVARSMVHLTKVYAFVSPIVSFSNLLLLIQQPWLSDMSE